VRETCYTRTFRARFAHTLRPIGPMLEKLANGMVAMEHRLDSLNTSLQVASAVVTEYLEVLRELQRISQLLKRKNVAKSSDGVDSD
jgi:hypothetical protein